MTKISQLTSIGDSLAIDDQFLIRDVSDGTTPNKSVTVSGIARALADGSATAPALAFAADKNTGLYRVGADQLSFSTNGTERLRIDSNGQIEVVSLGSAASPAFSYVGDPNTGTFSPDADTWGVSTNGNERIRIDSSGRLLVGTSSARNVELPTVTEGVFPVFNVEGILGNNNNYPAIVLTRDSDNTSNFGPFITMARSRGNTLASNTLVGADDNLGAIVFAGADGTDIRTKAATISAFVDGTPGANDMPGRLVFSTTADGASSPTERLRITSTGQVRLAGAGITFNGDTATANELDDYEEGTFTPTIIGTTTAGTGTYTTQLGTYTKVGNTVFIRINLTWTDHTGTGNMRITGLPFSSSADNGSSAYTIAANNLTVPANTYLLALQSANNNRIDPFTVSTSGGAWSNLAMDAAATLSISGSYSV